MPHPSDQRLEAYDAAGEHLDEAWIATQYHASRSEYAHMAISAAQAVGWGAVTAWRSRAVPQEEAINSDVPLPESHMGRIEGALFFAMFEAPLKAVDWLEDRGILDRTRPPA